jgi:TolA-binding protein
MTAVHVCPDSLLARAREGTLSSSEKRQLQAHLGQCEICRVSLLVGQDFDGALAARPDDTLLVTKVVAAVRVSAARRTSVSPPGRRAGLRSRLSAYGVAAALLTISCVVGAARPSLRRTVAVFLGLEDRDARKDVPAAGVIAPAKPPPMKAKKVEPSRLAPTASDTPQAPAEEPSMPQRQRELGRANGPGVPDGLAAKNLFAQANAKRRAGDELAARRLYQDLQQRHPLSPEAEVSRVALGRLLLDRSQDPKAALEQFDRAIGSTGQSGEKELAEEALFGRATALMRLGRADDERKTWIELLERFPGSVYADRAHARLDEMGMH